MNKQKTLLVIAPGTGVYHDAIFNLIVAETGEGLASHLCSQSGFAMGDLYEDRKDRKKEIKERFGDVQVKFINETDITEEELVKRNKEWYNSLTEQTK